jgi:hypothetical protein
MVPQPPSLAPPASDLFIVSRGFDFMPAGIGIFQLAYVVSEALTNAAKHSRASVVRIDFHAKDALVELSVAMTASEEQTLPKGPDCLA